MPSDQQIATIKTMIDEMHKNGRRKLRKSERIDLIMCVEEYLSDTPREKRNGRGYGVGSEAHNYIVSLLDSIDSEWRGIPAPQISRPRLKLKVVCVCQYSQSA